MGKPYDKWGNVVIYEGRLGSGTTLAAIVQIVETKPKKLVSNISLTGIKYTKLGTKTSSSLIDPSKIVGSTFLLDTAYTLMDSRVGNTQTNKFWTYLMLQSIRLNLNFVLTTPRLEYLDKRVRYTMTDLVKTALTPGKRKLHIERTDVLTGDKMRIVIDKPSMYFSYYPTNSVVDLLDFGTMDQRETILRGLGITLKDTKSLLKKIDSNVNR